MFHRARGGANVTRIGKVVAAVTVWAAVSYSRARGFDFKEYLRHLRRQGAKDASVLIVDVGITKFLASGYTALAADFSYLKAVQYFGNRETSTSCYPQLADLLQVTVSLDPHFRSAYRFAADAIPCNDGKEWRYGDRARDLLVQATEVFPDNWQLRLRLGYIYESLLHEYRKAAIQFAEGAKRPGAPPYFGPLAARLLAAKGDTAGAIVVTKALLRDVDDDKAKRKLQLRLNQLYIDRDLHVINAAIAVFNERSGSPPTSLEELVTAGLLPAIPADPLGGQYQYDAALAKASSRNFSGTFSVYLE